MGESGMVFFNKVMNVLLVAGMLEVVLELIKAAKIVGGHPIQNKQNILNTVKQLRHHLENLNTQISSTTRSPSSNSAEENAEQEVH
jgi:hypothetical protein